MISEDFGWQQSHLQAHLKKAKDSGWLDFFKEASIKHSIPLGILLAIGSRETNMRNIKGDGGHGRGIMQIDDRYHEDFIRDHKEGLDPASNIDYAAALLASNIDLVKKKLPGLDLNLTLKTAISGYNGNLIKIIGLVKLGKNSDLATTGKNYAADVLTRSEVFNTLLNQSI